MADLPQVGEQLLRVLSVEELRHIRVLQTAGPGTRGHGQGLGKRHRRRQGGRERHTRGRDIGGDREGERHTGARDTGVDRERETDGDERHRGRQEGRDTKRPEC